MGKVLLLTASFGNGHNQAAFAVKDALNKYGVPTRVDDYVHWLPRPLQRLSKFALKQAVKKTPKLYGLFYHSTASINPSSSLLRRLNHLGTSRMVQLLRDFEPDMVVSTFPMPNGVLSELRAKGRTNVKMGCIVTDYTAHRQWVHDYTDVYFVATDHVKEQLVSYGVSPGHIRVSGIPLREHFGTESVPNLLRQRSTERLRYSLSPDMPLVMVMGGGEGILEHANIWAEMVNRIDAQFVFICGRNETLYRKMKAMETKRVRVLSFTEDVHRWMAMSDCLITKAGGITITEAFAMELPLLLLPPIPGQETGNGAYAEQSGAAKQVGSMMEVPDVLTELLSHPHLLEGMRKAASRQAHRDAATRIARDIMHVSGIFSSNEVTTNFVL